MTHLDSIRSAFSQQAAKFGDLRHTIGSEEILAWILKSVPTHPSWDLLDVAAGTALLTRALALRVKKAVALDATDAMLDEGRKASGHLKNLSFVSGTAENLPFAPGSFDLVVSRLAFHYFVNPALAAGEMIRVCRPRGTLVWVDLLAPEDRTLAVVYDQIERQRDPSHVRTLSQAEIVALLPERGAIETISQDVAVDFERWVDVARTPAPVREEIRAQLERELAGGPATGLRPFRREGRLMFLQHWGLFRCSREERAH